MLKVPYVMTALQPIHTGSDQNAGTERQLRRRKIAVKNPTVITSNFRSKEERRLALLKVLSSVWESIDFDKIQGSRMMTIWSEFTSKVLASTGVRTKEQFLNKICEKFDIRNLKSTELIETIDKFDDVEFLQTIRDELQYLLLCLRRDREILKQKRKEEFEERKNGIKEQKKDKYMSSLFEGFIDETIEQEVFIKSDVQIQEEIKEIQELEIKEKLVFKKIFDTVPYVSGNSIRGLSRRLLMYDFCNLVGITQIEKTIYHQLFTGGNITDATGKEDIGHREEFIKMCPPIALLGSAIGNQTIEGELKVSGLDLQCLENGNGDASYWEFLDTVFGTRLDSSKTETKIFITENELRKNASADQMIYQYETFIKGSKLNGLFSVTSNKSLIISTFWRLIEVIKENNYICGKSAVDNGLIDIDIQVPENASKEYLDYLQENKEAIYSYFQSSRDDEYEQENKQVSKNRKMEKEIIEVDVEKQEGLPF